MIFPKAVGGVLSGLLLLGAIQTSQVVPAEAAPVSDPGPAGDFSWEGYNWNKRYWGGGPHFNGTYNPSNVSNPDTNGYVSLNITNPTGKAPEAAEFQTTRRGFGYGTYSTIVEKNTSVMQKEVVWGCLFTYDPDAKPGMNEIDLCEASAWGGGAEWGQSWPVEQGHGYWFDANKGPGLGNNTISFRASDSPILTHKMVWEPGKITFETFEGEGYTGTLLKKTVLEGDNIPVPAKEHVIFNFWVTGGGGGSPQTVKPEQVTVRDFSFTPASTALPPTGLTSPYLLKSSSPIQLSASSSKYKSGYRTAVSWTGTSESDVYLYVNGERRTLLNSGAAVIDEEKGQTSTYKLCDSSACSSEVTIKTVK